MGDLCWVGVVPIVRLQEKRHTTEGSSEAPRRSITYDAALSSPNSRTCTFRKACNLNSNGILERVLQQPRHGAWPVKAPSCAQGFGHWSHKVREVVSKGINKVTGSWF
jgi:hypothetical protein